MAISNPTNTIATLQYNVPPADNVRAYRHINTDPKTGIRETNYTLEDRKVVVENLRGKEDSVSLDAAGFQFHEHATKHTQFTDDAQIEEEYYPESVELIKELTGASKVVIIDHTIRRRRPNETEDSPQKRQPVSFVHVDQTRESAVARVHRHMPSSDAPSLLKRRFQIINLWRPISHPAIDWPLGLCDFRSIDPKTDLIPVTIVYPTHNGEYFDVKYSPNHKWKYLYGMKPDEVVLFKCFDSAEGSSVAPHAGFQDPTTPEGTPLRESIELRALAFYD